MKRIIPILLFCLFWSVAAMKRIFFVTILLLCMATTSYAKNCGDGVAACACGDTLIADYTLPGNLTCTNAGASLTIGADNVTLNLGGYTIGGDQTNTTYGINCADYDGWSVSNGSIDGYITNSVRMSGATDNVTISSIDFSNLSGAGTRHIIITGGSGIEISGNTFDQGLASGFVLITSGANSNLIFSDNTITGPGVGSGRTANYALYFYLSTNLEISGNTITGWDMVDDYAKIIYIRDCPSVVAFNNIIGSQAAPNDGFAWYIDGDATGSQTFSDNASIVSYNYYGYYFKDSTSTLTNCSVSNSGSIGYFIDSNTTVTATSCDADKNVDYGWRISGGVFTGIYCTATNSSSTDAARGTGFSQLNDGIMNCIDCEASWNSEDGFSASDTGTMDLLRVISHDNGSATKASSGDGATGHDTAIVRLKYGLMYNNLKSGYASGSSHTGGSGSVIYNCTFADNYSAAKAGAGGGIRIPDAGIWTIKNNITSGHDIAIMAGDAGGTWDIDYNSYNPRSGATPYVWADTFYSYADWLTNSSQDTNSPTPSDPKFVNSSANIFTLRGDSPAKNTGDNTVWSGTASVTDLSGRSITNADGTIIAPGGTVDIGAYEYAPTDDMFLIRFLMKRRR